MIPFFLRQRKPDKYHRPKNQNFVTMCLARAEAAGVTGITPDDAVAAVRDNRAAMKYRQRRRKLNRQSRLSRRRNR